MESIANESAQYHWPVIEVLTTYVRVHAPATKAARDKPSLPFETPTPDIQAALTVIARRGTNFEKGKNEILNLSKADLEGADLNGANLSGANLFLVNLSGAILDEANLSEVDLNGTNLTGANLYEANLSHTVLNGANLTEANLFEANLYEADLSGANLSGANLSGAIGLTQEQIDSAIGDKDTKLPTNLKMPESWKKNPF